LCYVGYEEEIHCNLADFLERLIWQGTLEPRVEPAAQLQTIVKNCERAALVQARKCRTRIRDSRLPAGILLVTALAGVQLDSAMAGAEDADELVAGI
jgi:hypothetical protein